MLLRTIDEELSVCKVADYSGIDISSPFVFTGSTDEEKSLVCPVRLVPGNTVERDDGWRAFRVEGILDFSLIGILAEISRILAENKIGIFVQTNRNKKSLFDIFSIKIELDGMPSDMLFHSDDYVETLSADFFNEMWVFGKDMDGTELYIKIALGQPNNRTICISFHLAEHPIQYIYK